MRINPTVNQDEKGDFFHKKKKKKKKNMWTFLRSYLILRKLLVVGPKSVKIVRTSILRDIEFGRVVCQ